MREREGMNTLQPMGWLRFIGTAFLATIATGPLLPSTGAAAVWFVTQDGAGRRDGSSLENAHPATFIASSANWSATAGAPGKISPGDVVNLHGSLGSIKCLGNGAPGNPITFVWDASSTMAGIWDFYGKDHITVIGINIPANKGCPTGGVIKFGAHSSNISSYCVVDRASSTDKTGSELVNFDYSNHCTLQNSTFRGFSGNCVTGDSSVSFATIKNNDIQTTAGGTSLTTDLIKLGWATDVLIEGNRLVLAADKSGGDPHNDILQCWHNYANTNEYPKNWKIINNWFEVAECQSIQPFPDGSSRATAFSNFCMLQYAGGEFLFEGNVFFSHDMGSTVGRGVNVEWMSTARPLAVKFYNNSFITQRKGLQSAIYVSAQSATATGVTLEIINNLFFSDVMSNQPIHQSISTMIDGVLVMDRNLFYGWGQALENLDPVTGAKAAVRGTTDYNTTWGAGGRKMTGEESAGLFVAVDKADFSLAAGSLARGNGADIATSGTSGASSVRREDFPAPPLRSRKKSAVSDIGAHAAVDSAIPPRQPLPPRVVNP